MHGMVKVAVLKDDPDVHGIILYSIYDTKSMHMISLVFGTVQLVLKEREVWNTRVNQTRKIFFLPWHDLRL